MQIAKQFELSERTVRTVINDREQMPSLLDKAPAELLEEMIANLRHTVRDFETMAYAYHENPSAALAAKRGAIDARDRLRQLLESTAVLPTNAQLDKAEAVVRPIAEELAELMARVSRGEITVEAAHERFCQIAEASSERQQALPRA